MKVENTNFTREHSAEENKAEGLSVKTAEDIWPQQRGSADEITRLFVAMVRAAGLTAYGAAVMNTDDASGIGILWSGISSELHWERRFPPKATKIEEETFPFGCKN
jgi:hypothetical protein